MKLNYLGRVIKGASFKKLNEAIDKVHNDSKKSKLLIFLDIIMCIIKYGAGYNDYVIFEFYKMNRKQRKTYMTRIKNKTLISMLNNEKNTYIFNEKNVFDKVFKDFLGREAIDVKEMDMNKFEAFINNKEYIFAKPSVGECGKGIEKIHVSDFKSTQELYEYIKSPEKNFGVIEEMLIQHPDVAKIYPYSLNCLRVVTIVNNNTPYILYAVFKTGNNGHFVDNLESGGFACHFDLDKGIVVGPGHTSKLITYDAHPQSGIQFVGYKLPFVEEVKELVKKAALVVKDVRYIGWDVCITPNGPAIVEGNDYPAYDFPQLPDKDIPRIGLIPKIEAVGIKVKK